MANPKQIIEGEVLGIQAQQRELAQLQDALSNNPEFARFMELNRAVSAKMSEVRAHIEAVMIPAYIEGSIDKSIKGDWGSVTVTESNRFEVDEKLLPAKFFKKVVDDSKIRKTYELEGKAPKGATQSKKYGIMVKIKEVA